MLDQGGGKRGRAATGPPPSSDQGAIDLDSSGAQRFVGEDRIPHTPRDERLKRRLEQTSDVRADDRGEPTLRACWVAGDRRARSESR